MHDRIQESNKTHTIKIGKGAVLCTIGDKSITKHILSRWMKGAKSNATFRIARTTRAAREIGMDDQNDDVL